MEVVVGVLLPAPVMGSPPPSAIRLLSGRPSSPSGAHAAGKHGFRRGSVLVRCATGNQSRSNTMNGSSSGEMLDYYDVLGVPVNASPAVIRKAYRQLQKKHHPDVAGSEGHAMTLLLNEAYATLMDDMLRGTYNEVHSHKAAMAAAGHTTFSGSPFSQWVGPDRPQGIFVDENNCIGCRECAHAACKTFAMDDVEGTARVTRQWGDPEPIIKEAIDLCPVNCIHYVEREDLPILEYLIRPQQKVGNGVYGGGWERPKNVFMAARTFKRQWDEKKATAANGPRAKETPAQRQARTEAEMKMKGGAFWRLWSWSSRPMPWQQQTTTSSSQESFEWSWKALFGRSSTAELLTVPVPATDISKVVELVQDWATTFASSSEIPLPMPFRTDPLPNGMRLTFVTANNGMLESVGALVATVEQEINSTNMESAALGEPFATTTTTDSRFMLVVRREGVTGTGALPGEKRILKLMKEVLAGRDSSYSAYSIPRNYTSPPSN